MGASLMRSTRFGCPTKKAAGGRNEKIHHCAYHAEAPQDKVAQHFARSPRGCVVRIRGGEEYLPCVRAVAYLYA